MTTNKIVYAAMYVSIIIVMSMVPNLGYIRFGTISFTTIPVILAVATFHLGGLGAISSSFTFAIFAYIVSITIMPAYIQDPFLFIVPKIVLGFLIWGIYKLLGQIRLWKVVVLAALTVILNTTLFTGAYFIVSTYNDLANKSFPAFITLIYINFIVEFSIAIVMAPLLYSLIVYLSNKYKNTAEDKW